MNREYTIIPIHKNNEIKTKKLNNSLKIINISKFKLITYLFKIHYDY